MRSSIKRFVCAVGLLITFTTTTIRAADEPSELRQLIEQQTRQLQEQAKAIEEQNRRLQEQAKVLEQQRRQIEQVKSKLDSSPSAVQSPDGAAAVTKVEEQNKKIQEPKTKEDDKKAASEKPRDDEPKEVGKDLQLSSAWESSVLTFQSGDKAFKAHLGGFFQFDTGWYIVPDSVQAQLKPPGLQQGSDLRRARLRSDGTCWEVMEWVIEMDFSRASDLRKDASADDPDPNVYLNNIYVGIRDLPFVGTVRVGHIKETLSFYSATSGRHIPFMERPFIWDAYEDAYFFDNGITASRTYFDQRLYSWLGLFETNTRTGAFSVNSTAKLAFDARVCAMPIYDVDNQHWMNIGISSSVRANPNQSTTGFPFSRITVSPLVRAGSSFQVPNLIDTGNFFTQNGTQLFSVCYNHAWGPLTVGAQYDAQIFNNAFRNGLPNSDGTLPSGVQPLGNLYFDGCSFEVLCFLTRGDHHRINPSDPSYARVAPVENFYLFRDPDTRTWGHGLGAWEVGLRFDHVRALFDRVNTTTARVEPAGGKMDSLTLGVNWYLNPNAKVMLNYVYTAGLFGSQEIRDGAFHSLGTRVQYDF